MPWSDTGRHSTLTCEEQKTNLTPWPAILTAGSSATRREGRWHGFRRAESRSGKTMPVATTSTAMVVTCPEGDVGDPFHIDGPHKSQAYVSTSTGLLKIALTVPSGHSTRITPDRAFLGILGMSVSLGEFHELQVNLQSRDRTLSSSTTV